jgi:hypothetical protein
MPTQEQITAARQREADATARLAAALNLPPPPPQAAAAVPLTFDAAFPPDSPLPVLGRTGPDVAIHSQIGDRVSLPHVGPVNCVTTDHTGQLAGGGRGRGGRSVRGGGGRAGRGGKGHESRGRVGRGHAVRAAEIT